MSIRCVASFNAPRIAAVSGPYRARIRSRESTSAAVCLPWLFKSSKEPLVAAVTRPRTSAVVVAIGPIPTLWCLRTRR
jgi:hypothetical protein